MDACQGVVGPAVFCAMLERKSGVIAWTDDVSLVFAGSNCQADVSDLMRLAVDHFRQVGVTVLGAGLTPCKSVGCVFVWQSKDEAKRTIEDWVAAQLHAATASDTFTAGTVYVPFWRAPKEDHFHAHLI